MGSTGVCLWSTYLYVICFVFSTSLLVWVHFLVWIWKNQKRMWQLDMQTNQDMQTNYNIKYQAILVVYNVMNLVTDWLLLTLCSTRSTILFITSGKPWEQIGCHVSVCIGDAGSHEQWWSSICGEDAEERCHTPRRWCGVHHDREARVGSGLQSPIPHTSVLLFSDYSEYLNQTQVRITTQQCCRDFPETSLVEPIWSQSIIQHFLKC